MNKRLVKALQGKHTAINDWETIAKKGEDEDRILTDEENAEIEELKGNIEVFQKQIDNEEAFEKARLTMEEIPDPNASTPAEILELETGNVNTQPRLPAQLRHSGKLKAFKGDKAEEKAYRFGQWFRAVCGVPKAKEYCAQHGIPLAVYQEQNNTTGGVLVPIEFDQDIIDLTLLYGVFRQYARSVPMASDTKDRSRRTGGLTAYFVGEGDTGTESTGSWDKVQLVAKKIMCLTRISNELSEDAVIDVGDNVAMEIGRAFAKMEDDCGFLGDGTSTYGGIYGVNPKLIAADATPSAGIVQYGTGHAWSNITLAELNTLTSRLPDYADANAKWFCNRAFFFDVMDKLACAAGGNTINDLVQGIRTRQFLGYPVVFANSLPKTTVVSTIQCLLGDLSLAADFGVRRAMTIAVSDSAYVGSTSVFQDDELAVRGTERFDINVHDVGDDTNAGPIVGLKSHSS